MFWILKKEYQQCPLMINDGFTKKDLETSINEKIITSIKMLTPNITQRNICADFEITFENNYKLLFRERDYKRKAKLIISLNKPDENSEYGKFNRIMLNQLHLGRLNKKKCRVHEIIITPSDNLMDISALHLYENFVPSNGWEGKTNEFKAIHLVFQPLDEDTQYTLSIELAEDFNTGQYWKREFSTATFHIYKGKSKNEKVFETHIEQTLVDKDDSLIKKIIDVRDKRRELGVDKDDSSRIIAGILNNLKYSREDYFDFFKEYVPNR